MFRVRYLAPVLLTGFIVLCSAFVTYITYVRFSTPAGWTFNGLTLLSLWLFTGYCWHQSLAEKPAAEPLTSQEQLEGVWPPPPTVTGRADNKD